MPYTAAEIAQRLGGEVIGDKSLVINGFAPADRAQTGDLTFAENESYFARAEQSAASAIIVDGPYTSTRKILIRVPNSRIAFAKVLPLFRQQALVLLLAVTERLLLAWCHATSRRMASDLLCRVPRWCSHVEATSPSPPSPQPAAGGSTADSAACTLQRLALVARPRTLVHPASSATCWPRRAAS